MALQQIVKDRIRHQFENIVNPTSVFWAKKAVEDVDTHLRGVSGGVTWRTEGGKLVDEPIAEAQTFWLELANARLKQLQARLDSEAERRRLRNSLAERRLMDDKPVNHAALYRKMSIGEWQAIFADWKHEAPELARYAKGGGKIIRLDAATTYVGTANYRVWFSSSLMKCRKFSNDKATASTDVIMRFWFDETPRARFMGREMLPHKQPGVQHNPDVVAWHREGFAEEDPNISDTAIMKARLDLPVAGGREVKRHYNLGFTSKQSDWLNLHCVAAEHMRDN